MPAYRFCRTDDIPLLVETHNTIYVPQVDGAEPLTVETFRTAMREIELWASSCMLAIADDRPVGVMLATKSSDEALIWRIAVEPEYQRQGHGRHMLTSLSQKAAILGPSRLQVEIPEDRADLIAFFKGSGYVPETVYTDFVLEQARPSDAGSLISEIGYDELDAAGVLNPGVRRSWERRLATLANRKDSLAGLAIASDSRIEAWLLHRTGTGEIAALGSADAGQSRALLAALIHDLGSRSQKTVRMLRVAPEEIDFGWLTEWAFRTARRHVACAHQAAPG